MKTKITELSVCALFLSLLVIAIVPADGAAYPYEDPVKAYYDEQQRLAQIAYDNRMDPEPVPYPQMYFWIDEIKTLSCNTWTPIYGHVPFEDGNLILLAYSDAEWQREDGNMTLHYVIANLSYHTSFGLLNYIHIPCVEEALGNYDVSLIYYPDGLDGVRWIADYDVEVVMP